MPGRNPEAAKRSTQIAKQLAAAKKLQGLSADELCDILAASGVTIPHTGPNRRKWWSNRMLGKVNLVTPVKVVYGPTDELRAIARALGLDVDRLVRVVNHTD